MKVVKILLLCVAIISGNALAKKYDPPVIHLEQALVLAKEVLTNETVVLENNYVLLKAEYVNAYNEYDVAYWLFRWERLPRIKGAWVEVHVDNQRRAKIYYGE